MNPIKNEPNYPWLFSQSPFGSHDQKLLSCEEADARKKLRYIGKSPKKHFPNNTNNLDHNVLGLQNRIPNENKNPEIFYSSIDNFPRSKSQHLVYLLKKYKNRQIEEIYSQNKCSLKLV